MSEAAPEVSVVMGVRDAAASLTASAASVLAQEGVELELILVDDGSTDSTPALLAELAARDSRVRRLRQEAAGLTAALIRGCSAAKAPFIARQDAGDLSLPGRLARQRAALDRHPEVVLVSCFTACVGPLGEELHTERGPVAADRPFSLFDPAPEGGPLPGPTAHGSTLFRRAAYERAGGYRAPFALAQDWDLWLRLAELGSCLVVGEALYRREISPRSLSFRFRHLQRAFGDAAFAAARERRAGRPEETALENAGALSRELDAARSRPSRRAEALGYYHLGQLLRNRRDGRALGYFRAALARDPFLVRAWVRAFQAAVGPSGRGLTMLPAVSIVVPTYGREEVLLDTVSALLLLSPPALEVLVIDQTPSHRRETERRLEDWQARGDVRWIRRARPSIPGAMNDGLLAARGERVLFVDDDVVPAADLALRHAEAAARTGAAIVAGQVLQPGDKAEPLTGSAFRFNSSTAQSAIEMAGGNFSVDRAFALAIAGFDENFVDVAYRFEAEFSDRARAEGGAIWFEPAASLRHLRAGRGGTRAFGDHLRTLRPAHAVGEYYYWLTAGGSRGRWRRILARPWRAIRTRHHLTHPWWIPATLIAELRGFFRARRLARGGRRLLDRHATAERSA